MDKISNPFTPGAGYIPPSLVGRDRIIEDGKVLAMRTKLLRAERGRMLIGPRGVGKTALLRYLMEDARQLGVVALSLEVRTDQGVLEELSIGLRDVLNTLDFRSKVKTGVREAFTIFGDFVGKFSINIGGVGLEVEPRARKAPVKIEEYDVFQVLTAVARAAKSAETAVGLYIDELQNMEMSVLSGIIVTLHKAAQDQLPIYLVGSGLPTIRALIGKSKTYAERMFVYENVGALSESETNEALQTPMKAAGVELTSEAASAIYSASKGYPFFIQECGYQVWEAAECSPISIGEVAKIIPSVYERLDDNFFDVRFDRVSTLEREFLRAMANGRDDEILFSEIAKRMGRSPNSLSMIRGSLIKKGMIFSPRLGVLAYTVPLFGEYLKRVM